MSNESVEQKAQSVEKVLEFLHEVVNDAETYKACTSTQFSHELIKSFMNVLFQKTFAKNVAHVLTGFRYTYVDVLAKYDKLYHFDDSAENIYNINTDEPCFTPEEVVVVNRITGLLHSGELFRFALKKIEEIERG